ncbi:hypothetical protein M2273_000582 [Mucilaginibacter lappiensis]|jgi:hypothetical protein
MRTRVVFKYNYRHLSLQGQIDTIINNMVVRLKYKELTANDRRLLFTKRDTLCNG